MNVSLPLCVLVFCFYILVVNGHFNLKDTGGSGLQETYEVNNVRGNVPEIAEARIYEETVLIYYPVEENNYDNERSNHDMSHDHYPLVEL